MRNSLTDNVATAVRVELARRGWRVNQLAKASGISAATLSHRLNGRTPFKLAEIAQIADALGVPDSHILAGAGQAADNSGQHSVSPAPTGEPGSRERLDGPATSAGAA